MSFNDVMSNCDSIVALPQHLNMPAQSFAARASGWYMVAYQLNASCDGQSGSGYVRPMLNRIPCRRLQTIIIRCPDGVSTVEVGKVYLESGDALSFDAGAVDCEIKYTFGLRVAYLDDWHDRHDDHNRPDYDCHEYHDSGCHDHHDRGCDCHAPRHHHGHDHDYKYEFYLPHHHRPSYRPYFEYDEYEGKVANWVDKIEQSIDTWFSGN